MADREMTLGEEIINLVEKGVDIPTVERMYRKYIDLDEKGKSDIGDIDHYCIADVAATLNLYSILTADIRVGDRMMVPLGNLGTFTATVQQVMNGKALFIFDDCVIRRPMNKDRDNAGGYFQSDLKEWIDTELYNMFPAVLKQRMTGLSIPTVGEIYGYGDELNRTHFEHDYYAQLPLMKLIRNRVTYYMNDWECCWLRNATKIEYSSGSFACVGRNGRVGSSSASESLGVRPEFWLYIK